ncbi:MAG: hypothetical protein L3J44_07055, partial [Campylobacteraceae bacterium]|nr:hypothetical protein [Campylobacteraceae bacterium]
MKIIYMLFLVTLSLFGASCADWYSNESYATASDNFGDIVGNNFEKYFNKDIKSFKEFKKTDIQGEIYYGKNGAYVKKGDNYRPQKDG